MLACIDVGFRHMGYSFFKDGRPFMWGCIHTEKTKEKLTRVSDDDFRNCQYLANRMDYLITEYKIEGIICETPTGGSLSSTAGRQMGMATGIIAGVVAHKKIPIECVTPDDVKKAVTGKRNGSKKEIMQIIRGKFPECKFPKYNNDFEHIADSCGVYFAGINMGSVLVKVFG